MSNYNKLLAKRADLKCFLICYVIQNNLSRVAFRTTTTSKIGHFVIIVNGFQSLTIITKNSMSGVEAVIHAPLSLHKNSDCACADFLFQKRGFENIL